MENNRISLTVAIPTYNRVEQLQKCIESVLVQKKANVDILISDNSTNDETTALIDREYNLRKDLSYIKNAENIGPDANFLQCLRKASGTFVLILGDDDFLLEGALDEILDSLKNHPSLAILYLNHNSWGGTFGKYKTNGKPISSDDLVGSVSYGLTYVSSIVFNKELFNQIRDPEKYIGSMLLQTHLALDILKQKNMAMITRNECVSPQPVLGEFGGYDVYGVFAKNWKKVLRGYSHEKNILGPVRQAYSRTIFPFLTMVTLVYRSKEDLKHYVENRKLLYKMTKTYPLAWIFLYPSCIVPSRILRFAMGFLEKAKGKFF